MSQPRPHARQEQNLSADVHRRDNIVPEKGLDTYRRRGKPPDPSVCPECNAVFHKGRWSWASAPAGAPEELCPACQRIRDGYPAGFLTISGDFFADHRDSVLRTIENEADQETREHPLHRIMGQEEEGGELLITTTDIHLPRRIGEALRNAYRGSFKFRYVPEDAILRARWRR